MLTESQKAAMRAMSAVFTAGDPPCATHVKTGRRYYVIGVALREHDLTPCAIYTAGDDMRWTRPLDEILYGAKWEWEPSENEAFGRLSRHLADFIGHVDFSALHH